MINIKEQKGITLIALVITIIILLILAGASISMLTGDNGITKNATKAQSSNAYSYAEEQMKLANTSVRTQMETNLASNSSYNATNEKSFNELVNLVKSDFKFLDFNKDTEDKWTVTGNRIVGIIKITYTDSNISKLSGAKQNGKVIGEIIIGSNGQSVTLAFNECETYGWEQAETGKTIDVKETQKLQDYKIYGNEMLPGEYQEIEYLESTGTQNIDTGVLMNNAYLGVDFAMMPTSLKGSGNYFYGSGGSGWLSFEHFSGNDAYWNIGNLTYVGKHKMSINNKYEYSIRYANGKFTSTGSATVSKDYTGTLGYGKNFAIFNSSVNGAAFSAEKLYYLKLYVGSDTKLVRDFIPSYRKSDNEPGLYDLVEKSFYTNVSNTKSPKFTVGENVFSNVGDLVTNSADENYNKYKISVIVTSGLNTDTYNIYLDEPLRKLGEYTDYIDFKNQQVVRYIQVVKDENQTNLKTLNIPTTTSIQLPEITLKSGNSTIKVETKVNPSKVEVKYN